MRNHVAVASFNGLAVSLMVVICASCGGGDSDRTASTTPAPPGSAVSPPVDINQVTKAGATFVVPNPEWQFDRSAPPLVGSHDGETWFSLPDLPEPVSFVATTAAGDRLVVAANTCVKPHGCGPFEANEIPFDEAPVLAWTLSDDLRRFEPVDLPSGVSGAPDTLVSTEPGPIASIGTSGGTYLVFPDGSSEPMGELSLPPGRLELHGSRFVSVGDAPSTAPGAAPIKVVSWVDATDRHAAPHVVELPAELPNPAVFLTEREAVSIGATEELAISLDTGEHRRNPLPDAVSRIASYLDFSGGLTGKVDLDGTIYLTPDPRMAAPNALSDDPSSIDDAGIAKRTPDGNWSVVSAQPVDSSWLLLANGGLYAVKKSTTIELIAE